MGDAANSDAAGADATKTDATKAGAANADVAGPGVTGRRATMADWQRLDIRIGTIRRAEPNEGARDPAFSLWIDLGPGIGLVQSSAKITERYAPDDLIDRQVVVVRGFGPLRVGGFRSDVLVLGVETAAGVVLLGVDADVPDGSAVS